MRYTTVNDVSDVLTPKEFITMLINMFTSDSEYIADHVIIKSFIDALNEWIKNRDNITWGFIIKVIDWLYTATFIVILIDAYRDNYKIPIENVIHDIIVGAMQDEITCNLIKPIVIYLSEVAPQLLEGIDYKCG
jgi:hypothetical protein